MIEVRIKILKGWVEDILIEIELKMFQLRLSR